MEKILEEIKNDYAKLTSLSVVYDEDENVINLNGKRYKGLKGEPSEAQINYLRSFDNVQTVSKSDLRKGNKWFISACINIAKKYPDVNFKVETFK